MKYYMTSRHNGEVGYWEQCRAANLRQAKREASRKYGAGYIDSVIMIARGDGMTESRVTVASKSNAPSARWVNRE